MIEVLLAVLILLALIAIAMLALLLRRPSAPDLSPAVGKLETLEKLQDRCERALKEDLARLRGDSTEHSRAFREEVQTSLTNFNNILVGSVDRISRVQKERLEEFATQLRTLTESNQKKADELRTLVETKLLAIQSDNAAKLEQMRLTVDEKLQGTLDKRLGDSFKLVSERLELVHKGLGEMQNLANGVGDLKRVLTNVKTRGAWGEIQLGNLLEQILTADQFERNVNTAGRAFVEFAIKLPGRDDDGKCVYLPIDAKFPKEDYERLVEAAERADQFAVERAAKDLETRVRAQARDIRDKYIQPPKTTDFGLLYLPTEGLYAEVIRRPGLIEALQRDRIVVVGPTTLAALLNSLQMGFRSLAIQKQSSEVWKVLGSVKLEFGKFGEALDKIKKKLNEAGGAIDDAAHRSRQIERNLNKVEALPGPENSRPPEFAFDAPVERLAGK